MKQDREAIRILVADIGYTEAANRTGIKRDTLYHWGIRYGWGKAITDERPKAVKLVKSASEAHAEALAAHEDATRMSLARSARHMAKRAEKAPLALSGDVHNVAKTAAIVHKWDTKGERDQATVAVNIAILGT